MDKDDQAARKARAEKLRKQISRITGKPDSAQGRDEPESAQDVTPEESAPGTHPASESPRDFIQRRMRELQEKKK